MSSKFLSGGFISANENEQDMLQHYTSAWYNSIQSIYSLQAKVDKLEKALKNFRDFPGDVASDVVSKLFDSYLALDELNGQIKAEETNRMMSEEKLKPFFQKWAKDKYLIVKVNDGVEDIYLQVFLHEGELSFNLA